MPAFAGPHINPEEFPCLKPSDWYSAWPWPAPLPMPRMTTTTVPAAEVEKIEAVLSDLGCSGFEELEKEDNGVYEVDDAKCKMGTVDIKLDKDYSVLVISRH